MFIVPVTLRLASTPSGVGVFLGNDVVKGAAVWEEALGWDIVVPVGELSTLSSACRELMTRQGHRRHWAGRDCWYLPVDEARHIRFSDNPLLASSAEKPGVWCATQDIKAGTELSWRP